MKKFMVLYMAPIANLDEWMKKPEEERKGDEEKMMQEWKVWMAAHPGLVTDASGMGKSKRVMKDTAEDIRTDYMLYSIAEAETIDEVADAFKGHPHFGIPGAWIDVVAVNPITLKV
mgnify:CR=1 FL=1